MCYIIIVLNYVILAFLQILLYNVHEVIFLSSLILSANYSNGHEKVRSHFHDCNQLLLIQEGSAKIIIEGKHYIATEGSLVLISRFEQHSIIPLTSNYNRYILRISSSTISHDETENLLFSVLINRPENFCHVIKISNLHEYTQIFDRIIREINEKKVFCDYVLDKLLYSFLAILYRNHNSLFSENAERHIEIITKIKNDFSKNYSENYSLDSLAAKYHLSPSYLSHIFKSSTGMSLMNYLLDCRIVSAKKLLATTNMSISEIVELCGFSDHSNFSRKFKEKIGTTPLVFRKTYKDN